MVNWNPSFPEALGLEWLANVGLTARVWAGAPPGMARMPSTVAETITQLQMSATVNPLMQESVPTLVDVIEDGQEVIPLFQMASLLPNADKLNDGWLTDTGASTNLFQAIDEDVTRWPGPARASWIYTTSSLKAYATSVDATAFAAGGANQNARIGWVAVQAIHGANTGFRKLDTKLQIGADTYPPAGDGLRDVHGYGAIYQFWWGEINPATGLPWKPADIADFGSAGSSRIWVRSHGTVTTAQYPLVYAIRLHVHYQTVENRAAVGVWRRPELLTSRLTNVATTSLMTVPSGAANWSKLTGRNYLYYWRQSVSPSEYGAVVADDVRWNYIRQHLGPRGQPPNYAPPPGGILALDGIAHDQFGRPEHGFVSDGTSSAGLVLIRSDLAASADSQPYRLDLTDLQAVRSTQKIGQRVTPGSAQSYLGVRFPIVPPASGSPTLTVAVIRVSDSVQIGGTFTITASAARALPAGVGGWRYVTGFLSSGASLASGIAYEIRLTSTAGGDWLVAVPNASLSPAASFGGSTNGAFIGATHQTDRDLAITLLRQPDPPTAVTATIANVAVTTFSDEATTVPHPQISWVLPAVGMGGLFARYEIQRQLGAGPWEDVADILTSSLGQFQDREVPRGVAATYRIRAVGTDGRFSNWGTSGSVTPTDAWPMLILATNHSASLQFVHLYEITDSGDADTVYPMLSTEHDEIVAIHGADYQVVFMEGEDRGVGWRTRVSLKQHTITTVGMAKFGALMDLVRSLDIPYVCALDHQGNRILGHVSVSEGVQSQPYYRFTAQLEIIPTHTAPVPAEVA